MTSTAGLVGIAEVDSQLALVPQAVTPSSNPAGTGVLFMDTLGNLKYKSPAGTVTQVVAGP
jgi:hypothetical protein